MSHRSGGVWWTVGLGMSLELSQFAMLSTGTKEGPPGFRVVGIADGKYPGVGNVLHAWCSRVE